MQVNQHHLNFPISVDGKVVDHVSLRRPLVRDLMAVKDLPNQAEQELELLALLAEPSLSRSALLELDLSDYRSIQTLLQTLMNMPSVAPLAAAAGKG
jgi:hypothetical protein